MSMGVNLSCGQPLAGQVIRHTGTSYDWATLASSDLSGLGTMSTQNANNVTITGGSITGITISDTDANFSITGSGDATKVLKFEVDTQTAGKTLTLDVGAQTQNRTILFPVVAGTDTLATLAVANSFSGITSITNATASTSTATGALVVTGGVGIVRDVNIGGAYGSFYDDAGTTSQPALAALEHRITGTPAAGFGGSIDTRLKSATVNARDAFSMLTSWVVATDASRTARTTFLIADTAQREGLRLEASGSAAMVGFLGASAVVRQTDGAGLTNNVTSGGSTDVIANYTDLVIYANDSAAIRNDLYQISRKVKIIGDALRLYGLLT